MIAKEFLDSLNEAYRLLEHKHSSLLHALSHRMFQIESAWYNGHYRKNENGTWCADAYPIPVIDVKGLCDVEIQFEKISVSTKMRRTDTLAYSFEKVLPYDFEAYGVEDYLSDYYHAGQTVQDLKENIRRSKESEIAFSFTFPFDVDGQQIFAFVKLLRREGFYY